MQGFLHADQTLSITTPGAFYFRTKIDVILTYSETIPSYMLKTHPFLTEHDSKYYKPYLMGEQLLPRPSEFKIFEDLFQNQSRKLKFTLDLHIMDLYKVSQLQDKWKAQIASACNDSTHLLYRSDLPNFHKYLVGLSLLTLTVLQVLANFYGNIFRG